MSEAFQQVSPPRLGTYFRNRQEPGEPGLPTLSVTMRDGLTPREDLERKMNTALSPNEHLRVRSGDIAYNMMRMWQGACGIADRDAMVSPAYVVLQPTDQIDSRFAFHWFKSPRMLHLLWAYSHGITDDRLRLYYDDFASIPIAPPPLPEQRRIADVLDAWDQAIATTGRLIAAKRRRNAVLAREMLDEGQPMLLSEVADVVFSGVDKRITAGEQTVRLCNYMDVLGNRRLTNATAYSEGSATRTEVERFGLREGDVVFTKDSETPEDIAEVSVVAETLSNVVCGYHLAVARPRQEIVSGRYLAHALRTPAVRGQFIKRVNGVVRFGLTLDGVAEISVPIPALDRQTALAGLLDAADNEVELLSFSADRLRLQKRGLIQKLLTGEGRALAGADSLSPGGRLVAEAAE